MEVWDVQYIIYEPEKTFHHSVDIYSSELVATEAAQIVVRRMMEMRGYSEEEIQEELDSLSEYGKATFEDPNRSAEYVFYIVCRKVLKEAKR